MRSRSRGGVQRRGWPKNTPRAEQAYKARRYGEAAEEFEQATIWAAGRPTSTTWRKPTAWRATSCRRCSATRVTFSWHRTPRTSRRSSAGSRSWRPSCERRRSRPRRPLTHGDSRSWPTRPPTPRRLDSRRRTGRRRRPTHRGRDTRRDRRILLDRAIRRPARRRRRRPGGGYPPGAPPWYDPATGSAAPPPYGTYPGQPQALAQDAPAAGAREHDGLFARLQVGFGYSNLSGAGLDLQAALRDLASRWVWRSVHRSWCTVRSSATGSVNPRDRGR